PRAPHPRSPASAKSAREANAARASSPRTWDTREGTCRSACTAAGPNSLAQPNRLRRNAERRTPNAERSRGRPPCTVSLGGLDARREDSHELVCFAHQRIKQLRTFDQRRPLNQSQPTPRLTQFLVTDLEFVNDISTRFRRFRLTVMAVGRRAGPQ